MLRASWFGWLVLGLMLVGPAVAKPSAEPSTDESAGRALYAQWTAAVVDALLKRGDADGLALALILGATTLEVAKLVETEGEVRAESIDALVSRDEALITRAIESNSQMSLPVLKLLALRLSGYGSVTQRAALADAVIQRTPEDATGWLLRLAMMHRQQDSAEDVTQLLVQAAAAVREIRPLDYEAARQIEKAYALAPAPLGLNELMHAELFKVDARSESAPSEQRSKVIQALGHAMAIPFVGYQYFSEACESTATDAAARKTACIALSRTFANRGGSLLDRAIGLSVWHRLVEGQRGEAEVIALKRRHHWQRDHHMSLLVGDEATPSGFDRIAERVLRPHSSEYTALIDAMREAGISDEPPPQWLPRNPEVLQAR